MCRERTSYIRGRTIQTEIVSSIFSTPFPENLEGLIQEASLYRVYVRVHNRRARAHRVPVSMTI